MRKVFLAAAALAAIACRQQPAPAPSPTVVEWAQQSPDHRFELRQRREASGCRVQAVVLPGEKVLWTSQTCIPTPSGMAFLSANGERLLVLDLFPTSVAAQTPDWTHLPLASVWSLGAVVHQYTGGDILAADRALDMRRALSWVRGDTLEETHAAARASPDGDHVVVELVDGRTATIGFDGAPLPTPPGQAKPVADSTRTDEAPAARPGGNDLEVTRATEELPAPPAANGLDEDGLYRWEDETGELHFGNGSQVPARYQKVARPVSGSVGVLPMDSPTQASASLQQPTSPQQPASQQSGRPGAPVPAPAGAAPAGAAPASANPGAGPAPAPAAPPPGSAFGGGEPVNR